MAEYETTVSNLQRMREIVQDYRSELLLIAPELRRWLAGEQTAPALRNDSEYIFRALATMFVELSACSPLCLCVDDIQWADQSTLVFLRHLAGAVTAVHGAVGANGNFGKATSRGLTDDARQPPVALLATGRSGYESLRTFCERMESQSLIETVGLELFSRDETAQLLALRLGALCSSISAELIDGIDKLCQGNPFFISETIREWYSRGIVVRTHDGWQRVHKSLDEDSSLPSTVRSALRTRLAELNPTSQLLLPAAAVIGRIVDLDLLGKVVAEVSETQLLDAVDELLAKRILVETKSASRMAFTHDLLRELILAELSSSRRRAHHRRIVEVLKSESAMTGNSAAEPLLAFHCLNADLTDEAFQHYLAAAQEACEAYLFDDAENHLQQAQAIIPDKATSQDHFRLQSLFSEAVGRKGQLPLAMEHAKAALAHSENSLERASVMRMMGTYRCFSGDQRGGRKWFDSAVKELGVPRVQNRILQALSINVNLFGYHFVPRPILRILTRPWVSTQYKNFASEILYDLSHSIACDDLIGYTDVCTYNVRLAKCGDNDAARALAYAKYGLNLGFSGLNARLGIASKKTRSLSVRYGELGIEHARRTNRLDVVASAQTSYAFCLYCAGKLKAAEQVLVEAEVVLRRCRDLHTSYAYHYLRHIYSVTGDTAKIIRNGELELEVAASSNDRELMGWANYGLTHGHALAGDFPAAHHAAKESIRLLEENGSNFVAISLMELGFVYLQQSQYQEAIAAFQNCFRSMRKNWFFFEICMPLFPRMVEAAVGPNWASLDGNQGGDLKLAKKYLFGTKFFRNSYPNIRPHAYRAEARYLFATGRIEKARGRFARALDESEKLGAKYEKARTLIDQGIAFPDLAASKQRGLELLEELGAVMPEAELSGR